jgi:hypothetical protein
VRVRVHCGALCVTACPHAASLLTLGQGAVSQLELASPLLAPPPLSHTGLQVAVRPRLLSSASSRRTMCACILPSLLESSRHVSWCAFSVALWVLWGEVSGATQPQRVKHYRLWGRQDTRGARA